ncbi:hypothetical protein BH10BAC6_BH10BAC6_17720 [soil metagenome]
MNKVLRYAPVALASIGLFALSHQPNLKPPELGFAWQDKLYHAIAYACYGGTIAWATSTSALRRALWIVGAGTLFAASDEWHQSFIPGRFAEVADFCADVVGLVVVALITWALSLRHRSDNRPEHRP